MRIAVIGKSFKALREYLVESGFDYVLFKDNILKSSDGLNTVYVDFDNTDSVIGSVKQAHVLEPFDCALTLYEQYIEITAKINNHLGLPGLPVDSAIACTNKSIMRTLFAKAPFKISPEFCEVKSEQDLIDFAKNHTFPLILKPANLSKSLLVFKNNNLEELLSNFLKYTAAVDRVYKKYAPHSQKLVLVEEFLVGSIHSVDAYVGSDGVPHVLNYIVDYQTGYDIGFEDNFHYSRIMPSKLSAEDKRDLIKAAEVGIKCLGMKNSAAHVEIIMTRDGPRVVEIGARNGGYRERMHGLAQGIDIYGNLIKAATNQSLQIESSRNDPCAVLELFPKTSGEFIGINKINELEKLQSLKYLSIKYKKGDYCGKSSDGYKAACVIMLHDPDNTNFNRDLNFVNSNVFVETK